MQLRLIFLIKKTSKETISIQMKFYINLYDPNSICFGKFLEINLTRPFFDNSVMKCLVG